ncbi:MAG: DUF2914 domain-containing protein [Burkholderiales bacterium]
MRMLSRFSLLVAGLFFALGAAAQTTVQVADAKLGKGVENRAIVDETSTFAVGDKAYLWLKVEGGAGQTVTVTWKFEDKTYPTQLSIGGSPWRVWANKTLHTAGKWGVAVTSSSGAALKEMEFTVQ